MITATNHFTSAGPGMVLPASAGLSVSATIPAGCVLRRSLDKVEWTDVAYTVPFTHTGADACYRIDCVTYSSPVSATLTIGGGV